MIRRGTLQYVDGATRTASVQLAGSRAVFVENVAISPSLAAGWLTVGNTVLVTELADGSGMMVTDVYLGFLGAWITSDMMRSIMAHASTHVSGAADAVKLDDLAAPDDNTDLNVSTAKHGLTPKAPNDTAKFLRGDATWAAPAASGGVSAFGDGSDGALSTSGDVTLTKEKNYTNLTINAGHTLFTKGFRVFVSGTLTINATGVIDCSGGTGVAGAIASNHAGGAGGAPAYTTAFPDVGLPGTGGTGGNTTGAGNGDGAGSTGSPAYSASALVPVQLCAGCGGGGGGSHETYGVAGGNGGAALFGDGTHCIGGNGGAATGGGNAYVYGAGGGGGGGVIRIYCLTINNAGTIRANGGTGGANVSGAGYAGGNGGGGGGGIVLVFYRATAGSGVGTLQVNGGVAGSGGNGGTNGAAGVAASFAI